MANDFYYVRGVVAGCHNGTLQVTLAYSLYMYQFLISIWGKHTVLRLSSSVYTEISR